MKRILFVVLLGFLNLNAQVLEVEKRSVEVNLEEQKVYKALNDWFSKTYWNSEIPESWEEMRSLEKLDGFWVTYVPKEIEFLSNLEELNLPGLDTPLPDTVKNLKSLKRVSLENHRLKELPIAIQEIENLEELNLTIHYRTSEFPASLKQMPKLKVLEVGEDFNLPANIFTFFPNLEKLKVGFQNITLIRPESLEGLSSEEIDAFQKLIDFSNHNSLNFPANWKELQKVEELELSVIPKEILFLKNLKSLKIRLGYFSEIKDIPDFIGDMSSLEILEVSMDTVVLPQSIGNLTNLKELYIYHDSWFDSPALPDSLKNLKNLEKLHLPEDTQFTEDEVVEGFPNLQELYIGSRKITLWNNLGTTGLSVDEVKSLKEFVKWSDKFNLGFSMNWKEIKETTELETVSYFPENIGLLTNLQKAKFQYQGTPIPDSFWGLKNIEELHLYQFSSLPKNLKEFKNLKKLYLGTSSLPEFIGEFSNLEVLDLSSSSAIIPEEFLGKLSNLKYLSYNSNSNSIPIYIENLPNLEELYINGRKIDLLRDLDITGLSSKEMAAFKSLLRWSDEFYLELPKDWKELQKLEILDGSYKCCSGSKMVSYIPEAIGYLKNLKKLKFSNIQSIDRYDTRIVSLPDSLGNLSNLQELDLAGNKIVSLPDSLGNLKSLQELDLRQNSLIEFAISLPNLKILNLTDNFLKSFPKLTSKLDSLELSNNSIKAFPENLEYLSNLKTLDISYNRITEIPETFENLEKLEVLNLACNSLQEFPSSMQNLKELNLYGNKLREVPKLEIEINIGQNPIGENDKEPSQEEIVQALSKWSDEHNLGLPKTWEELQKVTKIYSREFSERGFSISSSGNISYIPKEIGYLSNLQKLKLYGSFVRVPDTIGNLSNLKILFLGSRIIELPETIGNLSNLNKLRFINSLNLKYIPSSIGKLKNLRDLDLGLSKKIDKSELDKLLPRTFIEAKW
jgi:Leucine-rich repeat (LRR) protein